MVVAWPGVNTLIVCFSLCALCLCGKKSRVITDMQHQAQGLQQLFSGHAARPVSVLAAQSAPSSHDFVLGMAAELARRGRRVRLVETGTGELSARLGCRPLLSWQAGRPLEEQVISAGDYGLLHAPGRVAGDAALVAAARRNCDYLLFDGGRFSPAAVPLDPATAQTLVILLGPADAEAGYALVKGLKMARASTRVLLAGEAADAVARAAGHFMNQNLEIPQTGDDLCQIGNRKQETSSNTLTIEANLRWVVSRITENDQPKVAHGSCGKGAEEVY